MGNLSEFERVYTSSAEFRLNKRKVDIIYCIAQIIAPVQNVPSIRKALRT